MQHLRRPIHPNYVSLIECAAVVTQLNVYPWHAPTHKPMIQIMTIRRIKRAREKHAMYHADNECVANSDVNADGKRGVVAVHAQLMQQLPMQVVLEKRQRIADQRRVDVAFRVFFGATHTRFEQPRHADRRQIRRRFNGGEQDGRHATAATHAARRRTERVVRRRVLVLLVGRRAVRGRQIGPVRRRVAVVRLVCVRGVTQTTVERRQRRAAVMLCCAGVTDRCTCTRLLFE